MKNFARVGVAVGLGVLAVSTAFTAQEPPKIAPKLAGTAWFNAKPEDLDRLTNFKGRVTVLHFWTFECINCKHNLPSYAKWAKLFPADSVQVIGVHTPELAEEMNPDNVKRAIQRLGIHYPVVTDNHYVNWNNYKLQVWPTVFLIDKKGVIRNYWVGELGWDGADGYEQLTQSIQALVKEPAPK